MRFSALLLLPVLVAAEQAPLKDLAAGWFDKAKSFIPSGSSSDPIDAAAAVAADGVVERINLRNWQRKLGPKPDTEEEWMVYLTGGNKSCFGRCGPVDQTWTESVPLLAALRQPAGTPPLHIGRVDCEKDEVLCTSLGAALPSVWHFNVPIRSEPQAKTPLHIVRLNISDTQVSDFVDIPNAGKARYLESEEYTGLLHPFDGTLAKFGLQQPFGYFMWAIGNIPSWAMMLGISFLSRQVMSRRMAGSQGPPAPGAAPQAAPAQPAAAAGPKPGSAKKRR